MPCSLNFSLLRRKTWRLTVETTEEDGCTGQNRFPDASHRASQLTVVKARVGEALFKIGSPLPMCSQELCCPYKTYTGKYFFLFVCFWERKVKDLRKGLVDTCKVRQINVIDATSGMTRWKITMRHFITHGWCINPSHIGLDMYWFPQAFHIH